MEKIFNLNEKEIKDTVMTYSGRMATLKDFRDWFDCTVEFDDGAVLPHANYGCFWFGNIKHPDDEGLPMAPEIGQVKEVRGRKVAVVDMTSKSNVTFMFEDGKVVTGRAYCDLNRGYFGDIRLTNKGVENGCYVGEQIVNERGETATIVKVYQKVQSTTSDLLDQAWVNAQK